MNATVSVDREACRGTGLCRSMDPSLFRLTADGHAEATATNLEGADRIEQAQEIADCCPNEAITVRSDDTVRSDETVRTDDYGEHQE